jgi:hypothetical protein
MSGVLLYLPVALALLAEAAWIAVFAGLLEAFVLHSPVTGVPGLLLAAVAGFLAARSLPRRVGGAWGWVAVGLAATAGLLGWLASGDVRAVLLGNGLGGLAAALAVNPGGWLASLAVVRGIGYARLPVDPNRVGTMIAVAVPALAMAAVVGGMVAEPWRSLFLDAARLWVLVFLGSAILSLALARLAQVGRGAPVDWRRNPAWLALAGILVLVTAGLAVAIALVAGRTIAVALYVVAVPLLVIGFVVGFDRRSLRIILISLVAVGAIGTILRFVAPGGPAAIGGATLTPVVPDGQSEAGTGFAVGFFVLLLVLGVIAALVLARLWLRRQPVAASDVDETRVIDHGGSGEAPTRRQRGRRFRRRPRPTDAVAAYRGLLEDLDGRPPVARGPGETPAEHARRLRAAGHGGLGLDLLAADYGLVRFGGAALTPAETRRALGRAERLRQALLRVPVEAPDVVGIGVGVGGRQGAAPGPRGVRGSRRGAGPGADLPDADQPGAVNSILTRIRRGP